MRGVSATEISILLLVCRVFRVIKVKTAIFTQKIISSIEDVFLIPEFKCLLNHSRRKTFSRNNV